MTGNYVMAARRIADVLGSRANINYAAGSCGVTIRSRGKRSRRFRRGTPRRAPGNHRDKPLRVLTRILARQAAREWFEREVAVQRDDTRGDSAVKAAIYARYSSDTQRDASIADQLRVCREFAARHGWTVVQEFTDHAISGAIRALIEAILLEPDGQGLKITLKGDLAGMLSAARDSKRSPDTGDLFVQIKLVAGARNKLYRQLCWAAA